MNRTTKLLIFSDIFLMTGFGLISPILAIFIKGNLIGGTIVAAGIASMIFIAIKASLQLVFSKVFNPKDRIWMVVLGTFLVACVPFIYIFSTHVWHLYIAQAIYGLGAAFAFPAWLSLFTTNLTKGHEGFEWSVYSSCVGIGAAVAAYIGAILADAIGFRSVFAATGVFAVIGGLILLGLERKKLKIGELPLDGLSKLVHKH
jgi:DHA1 family quinolone resistance protein-like MFS transporter